MDNNITGNSVGIYINSQGIGYITHNNITKNNNYGIYVHLFAGIQGIIENNISENKDGIYLRTGLYIFGNYFHDNTRYGIYVPVGKNTISNNKFLGNYIGIYCDNNAYPIIKKYNIPCLVFVIPKYLDNMNYIPWWDIVSFCVKKTKNTELDLDFVGKIIIKNNNKKKVIDKIQKQLKKVKKEKREKIVNQIITKLNVKLPNNEKIFLSYCL